MNLKKGQKLDSGFSIIDIVELAEMQATGILARHDKCGTEVFHVLNDDSENLFAFAFATAPEDNTGVAHILEHAVLCGSENYPLKDAFLVLAQGSLQTFLNAMTFPDKTVYPASSVNEHDYFNLMSVYGDAVFRPLLSEWSFMQEGHRYEIVKDESSGEEKLSVTGVVYNEMKGAYSSLNAYAGLWSTKSIMPDTPYGFESGGNPEDIPELSWDGLKDFHRRRYSPANCRVFLAGNIPTEKQLAFLNDKFFSAVKDGEGGEAAPLIPRQKRWTSPKEYRVSCPAGGDTKPTVFVSWLCSDALEPLETMALVTLSDVLLGHDGSPLLKALVESGLGEDIAPVSGLDLGMAETTFGAGLRGVENGTEKRVEALILGELERLAKEGIPREEIEAALLSMEFSQREIKRAGGPFSLAWMGRSLRGWLHGGTPWESLLMVPLMEGVKRRIAENDRYLESLIRKHLLDNPHRALVTVEPQTDFLPNQEAKLAEKLSKTLKGLGSEERRGIIDKAAALEEIQNEADSPEALATIPHLSRADLSPEPERIPRRLEDLGGIPALCHELHTNGISYMDLAFPLDVLSEDDYLWLPFFSRAILSVGLPGMDYAEVSSLMAQTVGGFYPTLNTKTPRPDPDGDGTFIQTPSGSFDLAGRDWITYRLKCLDEKAEASLDLALRMINEADFSDHRRVKDLVLEAKNQWSASLAPSGSKYAASRSDRLASASMRTAETWYGLDQLLFNLRLAKMDVAEVAAKLEYLRKAVSSGGVIANLAGSAGALGSNGSAIAKRFAGFGPPKPRAARPKAAGGTGEKEVCEVFASPSLQVGFAAMSLKAAPLDTRMQAAEVVLAHRLSTGALWEEIRMKGGAYGAGASSDGIESCFSLSTYRDPSPLRSLDSFASILKSRAAVATEESDLVKSIIGCYATITSPRTPARKSALDFFRFLSRIDYDSRKRNLENLLDVRADDIAAAVGGLAAQKPFGRAVIAGAKDAEQIAKSLGTEVQELPV